MPFSATLRIDGVEGASTADGRAGEIDVVSFHWGASRPREAEAAIVHDFSFVKRADRASPALFLLCCNGERRGTAVFTARRRGEPRDFLRYTFTGVTVVSVRPGGSAESADDVPMEEVTLAFDACTVACEDGEEAGWGPGET